MLLWTESDECSSLLGATLPVCQYGVGACEIVFPSGLCAWLS